MAHTFETLGVIGAGNMGSGIAQKMATAGYQVVLVDTDQGKVDRGLGIIARSFGEAVERRIMSKALADAAMARVRGTADFGDLANADVVVEAVFEDLAVKRAVFARLEAACRPDAILATNTSSFSVTDIAEGAVHPERILGLHYFYHPAKNRLVEVIPGAKTSAEACKAAWVLQERMGKTPIASADQYGFIVNRYFVPWYLEAIRILDDGLGSPAAIDEVAKATFDIGMGPFELMNVTGVPIALHAANTLGQAFGPLYAPSATLKAKVDSGELWPLDGARDTSHAATIAERLTAVVFYVGAALVDGRVGSIEDTDIGARVGLRWRRGPFEMMNDAGIANACARVQALCATWHLPVPEVISRQAALGQPFAFEYVRTTVEAGVATLTINRPDALNALNETVVAQLAAAFDRAAARADVHGMVVAGAGKAFVAGADIKFFIDRIEAGDIARIETFTRGGQELLARIAACPKPVVARMHGLALGGGLELALACHAIVAAHGATVAFPETGIGIYPGLGGTQRTTRRVGVGLAKWLVLTGQMITAQEAEAIGLVDRAVAPDALDSAVAEMVAAGRPAARAVTLGADHQALADFFEAHSAEAIQTGAAVPAGSERVAKAAQRCGAKAPIAMRLAGEIIERGATIDLAPALELELASLPVIFSSADALAGLKSVGGRPPAYQGR